MTVLDNPPTPTTAEVEAAGAVMETDFNANTILAADSDDTPAAVTVAEDRILGRITGGNITALTAAQVNTLLGVSGGQFTLVETKQLSAATTTTFSGLTARGIWLLVFKINSFAGANTDNAFVEFNGDSAGSNHYNTDQIAAVITHRTARNFIVIGQLATGQLDVPIIGAVFLSGKATSNINAGAGMTVSTNNLDVFASYNWFYNGAADITSIKVYTSGGATLTGEVSLFYMSELEA